MSTTSIPLVSPLCFLSSQSLPVAELLIHGRPDQDLDVKCLWPWTTSVHCQVCRHSFTLTPAPLLANMELHNVKFRRRAIELKHKTIASLDKERGGTRRRGNKGGRMVKESGFSPCGRARRGRRRRQPRKALRFPDRSSTRAHAQYRSQRERAEDIRSTTDGDGSAQVRAADFPGAAKIFFGGERKMTRRGGEEGGENSQPQLQPLRSPGSGSRRVRARPDPFLIICRCFSVVTSLCAILCIAVNVLSAIRSFENGYDVFDGIFRCYAVLIAFFVVLAETEWGFVTKFWKVLEYWAGRGMLQIFVAVMTRAFPNYDDEQQDLVLLQNIAAYMLLGCGVVYVVSGILCIGLLKRSRQKKEISREQAVKDLEELERRREELEQLLIVESA